MNKKNINIFKNHLIISCQAFNDEPLNDTTAITFMAKAILEGGATSIRLAQEDHIRSIRKICNVPIMGLIKADYNDSEIFITPTLNEIKKLLNLNIDCIAMDATNRKRPNDEKLEDLINYVRKHNPNILLMADCGSINDVINANKLGFDCIGTTLVGRTLESKSLNNIDNDFQFIKDCIKNSNIPIIAEGGIWYPEEAKRLLEIGAFAIVVGSAITRPKEITKRWMKKVFENIK